MNKRIHIDTQIKRLKTGLRSEVKYTQLWIPKFLTHAMKTIELAIGEFSPQLPLAVALSGGADSIALLLACARRWPRNVQALHVNHGLQEAAKDFEYHCAKLCEVLQVPLHVSRVDARALSGQSPEAAARDARYIALEQMAKLHGMTDIALAHQADDQAETFLIALSRGSGLAGLAAMPVLARRKGLNYHRPLLQVTAGEIRRWLSEEGFEAIADPQNDQMRFLRNRIRSQLTPVLEEIFPHFRVTFARSASHAAQAQDLLDQLAQIDEQSTGIPPNIQALQALSAQRQANALRHWLSSQYGRYPSAAQLGQLLGQIASCTHRGKRVHLKIADGWVQRRGNLLLWSPIP